MDPEFFSMFSNIIPPWRSVYFTGNVGASPIFDERQKNTVGREKLNSKKLLLKFMF